MDCGSKITQKMLKKKKNPKISCMDMDQVQLRENTSLNKIVLFRMLNFRTIITAMNDDSSVPSCGVDRIVERFLVPCLSTG